MIDSDVIKRLVEAEITKTVQEQVDAVLSEAEWLESLEQKILMQTQNRMLSKFSSADAMPEILEAVKISVKKLFDEGHVPGVMDFVDPALIKPVVDQAVEIKINQLVNILSADPEWTARVERLVNQATVQETLGRLSVVDLGPIINTRIDDNMKLFTKSLLENFVSTGIVDQASGTELTVMDGVVVIENQLTTNNLEIVEHARIKNLVVTGSINTDNQSWQALVADISDKTLQRLTAEWQQDLVEQVRQSISEQGIEFEQVTVGGEALVTNNTLSAVVTESRLQSVGSLRTLEVRGESRLNNTLNVLNKRIGINTDAPEKALSVWDEEVSIVIGKHKLNQAYFGTNRDQAVTIGVNREPHVEINTDGLTTIKKLQVGLHKISHAPQVPGWAGVKGDMVFNSNPSADRVFAWVCLGAHRWQSLRSAE
jgi:hypothetical protein